MATTTYTTNDLAYYYADLHQLAPLSAEEQDQLLASTPPTAPRLDIQSRNRLIEGHLDLASRLAMLAMKECPPHYASLFPDIIGEVNLALVSAGNHYDVHAGGDVRSYFVTYALKAVKRAVNKSKLIRIPSGTLSYARAKGTLDQLYALEPRSLDGLRYWESDTPREPQATPITPTEAAPPRDPALRAQVESYLSYLTPRAQAILRLRFGLSEEDERSHSYGEVAQALGLSCEVVRLTERDALTRLRALVTGEARIVTRKGKACISCPQAHTLRLTQEQEECFWQAVTRLSEKGIRLTRKRVAQETGLSINRAQVFLRTHADEFPQGTRLPQGILSRQSEQREREARLEETYTHLEAQGCRVTVERLARTAHVGKERVVDFLHARSGNLARRQVYRSSSPSKAERAKERQARLEEAYTHLEAQEMPMVSAQRLARTAQVSHESARLFLQAREEEGHATVAQAR